MEAKTVRGFKDFSGLDALKRESIKQLIVQKFKAYGFEPAETPVIEQEEFVKKDQEGEAISDIFKLRDKAGRKLALRYELTFQLKRLVVGKKLPYRRYQIGEVFRDEPVSKARFRQFTQCDADVVGSTVRDEAELLKLASDILRELKIDFIIYINNRKLLNEILDENRIKQKKEVVMAIDKLDKLPETEVKKELKRYKADFLISIFKQPETYFKRYKAYNEIEKLKEYCKIYGVEVQFLPSLARGLLYYTGSVFEIKTKQLKETIAGGGSYLINGIPSTGISFGLDRISLLAKVKPEGIKCLIISIGQEKEAIKTAQKLRKAGIACFIMDKLFKGLDWANKKGVHYVLLIGPREVEKKKFKLRNMVTGKERLLNLKQLIKFLKQK